MPPCPYQSSAQKHSLPGCYYRDSDYCYSDDPDEGNAHIDARTTKANRTQGGDYVDLLDNPERFTGYSGPSARGIWKAIYEENCFGQSKDTIQAETYSPLALNPLLQLSPFEESEPEGECLEKRVYYKIISGKLEVSLSLLIADAEVAGLHASISTHVCYDYLNQKTGEWVSFYNLYTSLPQMFQRARTLNVSSKELHLIQSAYSTSISTQCCYSVQSPDSDRIFLRTTFAVGTMLMKRTLN